MAANTQLFILPLLMVMTSCTQLPPAGQLHDGKLRPCPNSPNCVSSEENASTSILPITFTKSPEQAWQQIHAIVVDFGGETIISEPPYLWATFSSKFFGFVDDVELRMDQEESIIHIRSGSRVGYWDLGVNKKRVEKIRTIFSNNLF